MGWLDRLRIRRRAVGGRAVTTLDREANAADVQALVDFARSRRGVEFYVEPETFATDTTAMAIAHDGEWTRRRVGTPEAIKKVAGNLGAPVYDVRITGYPQRMRDWNARDKTRPRLDGH